jgi:Zn-dependent metalloprotease
MTWDYYKLVLGRNGVDGQGRKALSRVHYGRRYENAFWNDSCFCMTYGDGADIVFPLVELDVVAHEISHGLMSTEANLTYSGESGGLNESNSDILGTLVEFFANTTADTPEYWIGEKIMRSNYSTGQYVQSRAVRYMDNPARDGFTSPCWYQGIGNLDVHVSSGPANHMFFLLSNPAANISQCTGQTVNGIGRDKAAKIWYSAVTNYMTASTDYHGARTALLNAAAALHSAGSAEYNAVAAAFSAINVN